MTEEERTASEIILSLEQRVETMEGLVRSIDHNIKLVLSRQNAQLHAVSPPAPPEPAPPPSSPTPTVEAVEFVQVQPSTPVKKRVVQEKLVYGDLKGIILAQVEIFDMSGKLVDKKRTNNAGKWASSLFPGKYMIRVAKQKTAAKPQATGQYEIIVTPGIKPLQLENRKL
ncbi:hypothetical protein LCGC14_0459030 [marine sediment metagenome]|uniref:Carboxypeptidase regulatory-like domain-containing protein n=1 Tax=marine sediment metagenome TaxID=412755 RepID=A0A0F9SKQ5_9ZZZZ